MSTKRQAFPEPDFADSADLRRFCNDVRAAMHSAAMMAHYSAAEIQAALETIPDPEGGFMAKMRQKRRARRVARHMKHVAECLSDAGAGAVRTWGAFRAEYCEDLPKVRGRRAPFKVVAE